MLLNACSLLIALSSMRSCEGN